MVERFTQAAREAVEQAQVRARELGHDTIGPEHLLPGVLADVDGPAAAALYAEGPRRGLLLRRLTGPHLAFQPDAKQALVLSLRQALALHHGWIGTEHVLLGLLALDGDPVGHLLVDGTADPAATPSVAARVRERVLAALSPVT